MTETHSASVLRRKFAPRASPPQDDAGAAADGPARTLVRSFARAVSDCAPLMVEGDARRQSRLSLGELIDSVEPDAFVALVADDDGPPGLVTVDQSGFAALVEAMTIGRLSTREPVARRATGTDSALLGAVLNAAFAGLDADDPAAGLAIRRPVPDIRLLPVLLDDASYALVSLEAALVSGDVQRPARITLAVPQPAVSLAETGVDPVIPGAHGTALPWSESLSASVMAAPAALTAELGRVTLPLSEVLSLGQGRALTLPLSALEEVRLVALDGAVQALGRLGQSRGMRAVRLTVCPDGPLLPDGAARPFEQARSGPLASEEPGAASPTTGTATAIVGASAPPAGRAAGGKKGDVPMA